MKHKVYWTVLECICRFLGISTAAVLTGVGVETLLQGRFKSLGYYLLFSAAAVAICELSFFLHLLLSSCFTQCWRTGSRALWKQSSSMVGSEASPTPDSSSCQSESTMYVCWRKIARLGGFQKFLGYVLLSVACFLHPVLVWHVTIPGTMLVVTGVAYFLLSKQKKLKPTKESSGQTEQYADPTATAVAMTHTGDTEQTYTFNSTIVEKKASLFHQMGSILRVKKDKLSPKDTEDKVDQKRQVQFQEKVIKIIPSITESLEEQESEPEETTSDTAPIITPPDSRNMLISQMTTGLF
ncbi:transmembrane protein 72 isoform X1 [Microcaecilia unicolor]|uniref:Transmembrane protein 72 isoform X1 n=1 Tax=Microcaecilia unicolor TaxID=1415580 RepID=A0A6P7XU99_9AMPH|nr:transmembrane protein 72 isoform X1 [Microcaecilia unicolor]